MKRFNTITVIIAVLLAPTLIFAAEKVVPSNATANADNTITIPIEIANEADLMAADIPLKFSEGVTLKEVSFEGTRVEHFDLTVANIDNTERTVIIGLVTQITPERVPNLESGQGTVANLVFEIDDPTVTEITLQAHQTEFPHHSMTFIYNGEEGMTRTDPTFNTTTVALSGVTGSDGLPTQFELAQNYPNPFNPTTEISFALPAPADVNLKVFNLLGQEVKTLVNENMPAGNHIVTWDGTNENGATVSSGVYFYRIEAGSNVETKKMMMLK